MPKDFKAKKEMERGESDWRLSEDGVCALQWIDKKPVLFLSNFHNPQDEDLVRRKQKDGKTEDVKCKKLVKDYNKHMGYVDKSDMLKSCYELDRKSRKWWHRIFWHFLDLSVVNAFILFKAQITGAGMSLKEFKVAVVSGLVGAFPKISQARLKPTESSSKFKVNVPLEKRFDKVAHLPQHGRKVRCANCSTKAEPHRTRWHCTSCEVGLCLSEKRNCFIPFHTE